MPHVLYFFEIWERNAAMSPLLRGAGAPYPAVCRQMWAYRSLAENFPKLVTIEKEIEKGRTRSRAFLFLSQIGNRR